MDRFQELRKYVTKDKLGIEVGPWHAPIAPKREGYNCLVLDLFPLETLREKAKTEPYVPANEIPNIEDVDLLGSSSEIGELAQKKGVWGRIDYILSSHNFEHLPNPVRFLQGCERALKPGGVLSMAVPDRRACFDYFRPHTTLSAWLEAHFAGRETPTCSQLFDQVSLQSQYHENGGADISFSLLVDPARIIPMRTLREAFHWWRDFLASGNREYLAHCSTVHCSTFTPASFELLLSDLKFLGLTGLRLIEISGTYGNEFFVHLRRPTDDTLTSATDPDRFYERRTSLLHRVNNEAGANSVDAFRLRSQLSDALASIREQGNRIAEQQKQIETAQKVVQEVRNECDRHIQRIQELEAVASGVLASKSWRLTGPLRVVASRLRRFIRR